jgi:polyferredoxin
MNTKRIAEMAVEQQAKAQLNSSREWPWEAEEIYIYILFFFYVFLIHLGCFYSLAFVNYAAVNMGGQVYLLYHDLHVFGYMIKMAILLPKCNQRVVSEDFDQKILSFLCPEQSI